MNLNATLLGQMVTFALFVFITLKYVWPPVAKALEDRQKRIADGLAAADEAQRSLKAAQEKAAEQMHASKVKAAEVLDQAHLRASQLLETAKEESRRESARMRTSLEVETQQALNNAKQVLREQIAQFSVSGAEKILKQAIDSKAHRHLIDEFINVL